MKRMKRTGWTGFVLALTVLLPSLAEATLELPRVFGDGMVVQRTKPVHVWGWGDQGDSISVEFNGQTKKTAVGKTRKPVDDPVWGMTDLNTFGTDEFIEWCRLVGCEPYICTNAGNGTPEEMKQWVEYCNATEGEYAELRKVNGHEKPFNVKYWSIGNENYGWWEIGRKTPDKWGPLVHKCAEMMRLVDPDIELAAAAWLDKREWNLPFVIAETGMSGHEEKHPRALSLMRAQAPVAEYKEFKDNVAFVGSKDFYRPKRNRPDDMPSTGTKMPRPTS